jgi:hypothetical protein
MDTVVMGIWILIVLAAGAVVIGLVWLLHRDRGLDRAGRRELRQLRATRRGDKAIEIPSTIHPSQTDGGTWAGPMT